MNRYRHLGFTVDRFGEPIDMADNNDGYTPPQGTTTPNNQYEQRPLTQEEINGYNYAQALAIKSNFYEINAQEQAAMVERSTLVAWQRLDKFVRDVEEGRTRAGGIEKIPIGTIDVRDAGGNSIQKVVNAMVWVSKQNLNNLGIRWVAGYNGFNRFDVPQLSAYNPDTQQVYDQYNQNYTVYEFMAGIVRAFTTLERPNSDFASTNLVIDANTADFSKSLAEALANEKQDALDVIAANKTQNEWRQDINVSDGNVNKLYWQEQQKQALLDAQYRADDLQQRYQEQVQQQQQEQLERIRQANEQKLFAQSQAQAQLLAQQQADFEHKQQELLTAQSNQFMQSATNQAFNEGVKEYNTSFADSTKDYNNNFGVQTTPTNLINTNFAPKPPANLNPKPDTNTGAGSGNKSGNLKTTDNPAGGEGEDKKGLPTWAKWAIGIGLGVVVLGVGGVVAYKVMGKKAPKEAGKNKEGGKKDKPKPQGSNKKDLKQKPKKGDK